MFAKSNIALAALSLTSAVVASPVRRQETSSMAVSTASAATTTAATTMNTTYTGCPAGYFLTYAVNQTTYPGVQLSAATSALQNWGTALPPPIMSVNSSGSGVGAMRTWSLNGINVSEVLVNSTVTNATGSLRQEWNLTQTLPIFPTLIITNATDVLTVYTNTTTNDTSAQLFVNFCTSNQTAGLAFYDTLVTEYLTGLGTLLSNTTGSGVASPMSSAAPVSAGSSMSSMASMPSMASAASSSIAGIGGTVTSGGASVLSTAVGGASSVASTAVAGATSVGSVAASAVTGAANTAASGVTSILSAATSVL